MKQKVVQKRGPYNTKKRRHRKKIIIALIVVVIIMLMLVVIPFNSFEKSLVKLGYTKQQANEIDKIVSLTNHQIILNTEKNDTILNIITSPNYQDKNLKKYIKYYEKNKDINAEKIIKIVNSGYDILDKDHHSFTEELIKEKYFIDENLDRYISYKEKNSSLDAKNVITDVNSNLDKRKYVDVMPTDTKEKNLAIVNKYYYLDKDYEPTDLVTLADDYNIGINNRLRREAANAFMKLSDAALLDNIVIKNASGYRSYKYQTGLYNSYKEKDGKEAADNYSARPGYSEHQSGLATDVNEISINFETSDAFKWLAKNADKYGFILRYPKGKEYITGYQYEPWHYRYVGKQVAKQIKEEHITYEEYYAYYVKAKKES